MTPNRVRAARSCTASNDNTDAPHFAATLLHAIALGAFAGALVALLIWVMEMAAEVMAIAAGRVGL